MTAAERLDAIARRLSRINALTTQARDYAASGPDHTHNPNHTAEQSAHADADEAERIAGEIAKEAAAIAGGEYRDPYNGWQNRETWNASLWIDNDQGTYEAAREIIREACAGSDYDTRGTYTREQDRRYQLTVAGDALKDWFEDTFGPTDTASPLADAWSYTVAVVDWLRVAEGLAEGMDPDPTLH